MRAEHLVAGTNELTIHWPAISGGGLPPTLGWLEMRVDRNSEAGQTPAPRYRADEASLLLPAFVRLDYQLRVPAEAVLEIERLSVATGSGGDLVVELAQDGVDTIALARLEAPDARLRVDLSDYSGKTVRLSLEAVPRTEQARFSGLVVESPVIRGAATLAPVAGTPVTEAPATEARALEAPRESDSRRPNVLIYVVDTLRRDHIGIYGYPRAVSPELDQFAEGATIFDNAVRQAIREQASTKGFSFEQARTDAASEGKEVGG